MTFIVDRATALCFLRPGEPFSWGDSENTYDYVLLPNGLSIGLLWMGNEPKPTLEEIEAHRDLMQIEYNRNWEGLAGDIIRNPILHDKFMKALTTTIKANGLVTALWITVYTTKLYANFINYFHQLRVTMANSAAIGDFTEEEILLLKDTLTANGFDSSIVDLPE